MFDYDIIFEIYSYLVELLMIKRKKFEFEISLGVGCADSSDLIRLDAFVGHFYDFFVCPTCSNCKYNDECPEEYKSQQPNYCENWEN